MDIISLIGNLKTHEMEKKAREEAAPTKKKSIAFKSSSTLEDDEEDEEEDEELSLLCATSKGCTGRTSSISGENLKAKKSEGLYATIAESPDTSWPIVRNSRRK